jgi:hypothetical protein
MTRSLAVMALFLSVARDARGQDDLGGPLEIGTASGRPGEVVTVPVYGTFHAPLVFLVAPFQFDVDRLTFLSYSLEGTIAAGARMGIEFNTFEEGDAIFGIGNNGMSISDRVHLPPGERQPLGVLRFRVRAAASTGSASVTPVFSVPETGGTVTFALLTDQPGIITHTVPDPLISGGVFVLPPEGPRPVGDFQCRQLLDRAVLSFIPTEAYDRIEVSRDGAQIASLPGSATGYTDPLPGPGEFTYSAVAWKGEKSSLSVECVIQSHAPAAPPVSEFDCKEGTLTWTSPVPYDQLHIFRDGQEIAAIPGAEQSYIDHDAPGAMAVYAIIGELEGFRSPEVNCLAHGVWVLEAGDVQVPLGASRVTVPIYATNAAAILGFGFCLDIDSERFKFRTNMAVGMAGTAGIHEPELISMGAQGACGFPAVGVAYDFNAPRNPEKYLQVGVRQHIFNFVFEPIGTFSDGDTFDVSVVSPTFTLVETISQRPDVQILGQIRFGTGGPQAVKKLSAQSAGGGGGGGAAGAGPDVALSWENGSAYEKIRIERNGVSLGEIPGGRTEYVDPGVPSGVFTYKVVGMSAGKSSFPTSTLFASLSSKKGMFLRGDANRDSRVNVADVLAMARFLFRGEPLPCLDAADADDSGNVDVTDVIYTISFLFQNGESIKAPGTVYPWIDPTPDELGCEG